MKNRESTKEEIEIKDKTKAQMWAEHKSERTRSLDDRLKLSIMTSLYPRLFGKRVRAAEGLVKVRIPSKNNLPTETALKAHYEAIAAQLARQYPQAMNKTHAEIKARKALEEAGNNFVITSAWIGRKNVDLLLPSLTGISKGVADKRTRFTGIALEIDGAVHQYTPKFLGDFDKDNFLSFVGILPVRLTNKSVDKNLIHDLLGEICIFTAIDTRAKRRMWKRIHLTTLFLNWKIEQLENAFGFEFQKIGKKILSRLQE